MKSIYFTVLGLLVSTLYLQAYWSEVSINPFPYIDPSQYLAYTIGGFSGVVISFLFGSAWAGLTKKRKDPVEEVKFSWKSDWYIVALLAVCIPLGVASLPLFLIGVLGLLGLFASYRLANSKQYEALNEDIEIRRRLILAFFILPPFAMFGGQAEAHRMIYFDIKRVGWVSSEAHQEIVGSAYFGKLGNILVFVDRAENRKFLIPSSSLNGFAFKEGYQTTPNQPEVATP